MIETMKRVTYMLLAAIFASTVLLGACALADQMIYDSTPTKENAYKVYDKLLRAAGYEFGFIKLEIVDNPVANAWTNGSTVVLTTGIIRELKTIEEMAAVLAHEIAHNTLGHTYGAKQPKNFPRHFREINADRMAVFLLTKAGYGICGSHTFWKRIVEKRGLYMNHGSHPTSQFRMLDGKFRRCQ